MTFDSYFTVIVSLDYLYQTSSKSELVALLDLSSSCLVAVGQLFLAVPWVVCSL